MKMVSLRTVLFAAGLSALGVSLTSAQTTNTTPPPVKPTLATLPPLPADIQKLIHDFAAQRDAIIAVRQALIAQLKGATPEQRAQIVATLRAQAQQLMADQRVLAKSLRDQMRQLRLNNPPPGGG